MKRPLGNTEILEMFETAIKSGTLSHAYMLCAPCGGGKKTVAGYVAASALCLDGAGVPCGGCRSCAMLEAGAHPDRIVIKPDGEKVKSIKIGAIRDLKDACYVKPAVGGRRAVIIENAETMTAEAQNALLKLLEEPPQGTLFLLLTENAQKLLPTVRSRCITVNLPPLSDGELKKLVSRLSGADAEKAVNFSAGIAGDAVFIASAEGVAYYREAENFLSALISRKMYDLLKLRDKIAKSRAAVRATADCILKLLRDVCAAKADSNAKLYFSDSTALIFEATNKLTKTALDNIIDIVQNLKFEAENNSLDIKLCTASALLLCWEEIS